MSQVGCRLMVASSANTSRPRLPAACGDIAWALATKAAMSSDVDDLVSGNDRPSPAFSAERASAELGLVGSPGIVARVWLQAAISGKPPYPAGYRNDIGSGIDARGPTA